MCNHCNGIYAGCPVCEKPQELFDDSDYNFYSLQKELETLSKMTLAEAQGWYNVDTKEEARKLIEEYWDNN